MILREGGNRFSGDFKASARPGERQSDNLTARHRARGDRRQRHRSHRGRHGGEGGPLLKDRPWFFASAALLSANSFVANMFMDDGSQGIDDQYIKSAMARLTRQLTPRNKVSAYFDESTRPRPRHAEQRGSRDRLAALVLARRQHRRAQVDIHSRAAACSSRPATRATSRDDTNSYQEGVEKPRFSPEWFASASRLENDLGGRKTAATSQTTQSPERHNIQAAVSYVTGAHSFKAGFQYTWGDFWHTVDANGDLTQQYRSNATGVRYWVPDSVIIRNTPLLYGERLNRDLGLFVQDSWRLDRLTLNGGIRWENLKAQVLASESGAGRFVPARSTAAITSLPDWKDWAPRFGAVYDLFGTGKTAVRYSLNRYNQIRTTGIATNYNPFLSQTSTALPWRDVNLNDVAEGERGCTGFPRVDCEIDFRGLSSNFGIAALNEFGDYPRTWNLESALEVQHQLASRLSVSASWFTGSFHNLTTTINQAWTLGDYTPYTFYNPLSGQPLPVFARSLAASTRPTRNLDTYDPDRRQKYEAVAAEFRWRLPRGGQLFGGGGIERERIRSCTAPDDPNYLSPTPTIPQNTTNYTGQAFCDDFAIDIPWKKGLKLAGTTPVVWGIDLSVVFQSNESPNSTRTMNVTRGITRYPASCPAPCPAGQIVMPSDVFGQTSLIMYLEPARATFVERINQLDFKVSRTFKAGRFSVLPVFEVFNVNNSDAIVSYVTTNALAATYLTPNSIMQGRMYGLGATIRW